jgi:hypothetical protein
VHGALAALHALGVVYNFKKGNKFDTVIHSLVFVYDLHSTTKHYYAARDNKDKNTGHNVTEPFFV